MKGRDILPTCGSGVASLSSCSSARPWRRRSPARPSGGSAELEGVLVGEPARKVAEAAEIGPAPGAAAVPESSPGGPADDEGPRLVPASITGAVAPPAVEDEAPPWSGQFLGQQRPGAARPAARLAARAVKLNRGGSSLSLRADFENGSRAACKPNQIHMHSQPRREIAAYRVNRLLGLASVPPAIGRRFIAAEMADRFRPDKPRDRVRFLAEAVPERDGSVLSEMSWWVPDLGPAMLDGFEIDSTEGVVTWKRYLTAGVRHPAGVGCRWSRR